MAYVDQPFLESMLSAPVVLQLLDDQNTGVVNAATLSDIVAQASALVDGGLAVEYGGPFPIAQVPTPHLIRHAAFLYAKALMYQRHPEYVKQHGAKPMEAADAFLEKLIEAKAYLTDFLTEPVPENVGGVVVDSGQRMVLDGANGSSNSGDF